MTQKIVPYLWFNDSAALAARLYASTFPDLRIVSSSILEGTPSGNVENLTLDIAGQSLMMMSAGPYFKLNPSISLLVNCTDPAEVDAIWEKLSPGGKALMPLDSYPFSPRYGWTEDRFGVSWQLYYQQNAAPRQRIIPTLMFTGGVCGKAEEAMRFWTSVFGGSSMGNVLPYGPREAPDAEGTVKHGEFTLEGQTFACMDSAHPHDFTFNEALSLMVRCGTQEEIDRLWSALSAHPEAEQCGWLKDRYGVSWQIVPAEMASMLGSGDRQRTARVTQAFLKMKKMDLAELRKAFSG
jgi:predicted 3-demethylubiquinone-9 3-methyltransferase (glyoxalase superfamily)